MASTKAWGQGATGSEDVLYRATTPDEASELDPSLAVLPPEQQRVSSAQSTRQQEITEASESPVKARGEVCSPADASVNSEPAERRHSELTSR